jgi:hypothetical protein
MPVPDFQSIMLPFLEALQNGEEVAIADGPIGPVSYRKIAPLPKELHKPTGIIQRPRYA